MTERSFTLCLMRNEKTVKIAICVMERASEKTEDTFINIPIYTESHNLSIINANIRMYRNDHLKMYKITL